MSSRALDILLYQVVLYRHCKESTNVLDIAEYPEMLYTLHSIQQYSIVSCSALDIVQYLDSELDIVLYPAVL
jgi:hypothetical protein